MKHLLLLGSALLVTMASFAQIKKESDEPLNLSQYWKNQQKNDASSQTYLQLFKKKEPVAQQLTMADILPLLKEADMKNNMPVLYPDSDYVFNMPGTHAFDPTKVKGGVFFIKPQVERVVPKKD